MDSDIEQERDQPALPPQPEARRLSRAERREKAASDALRTLIRDLHMERFGATPPRSEEVGLSLRLSAAPGRNWELKFDPPLADQLLSRIEDAQAGRGVYIRGRVYCFRCESSGCEHAVPPTPLSVFAGYTPTGCPEWRDLAQVLIEGKDERVDRLFGARPETVARLHLGHDLKVRQLSSFGRSSKTYAILGQVVAGYFRLPPGETKKAGADRLAITFQAVETRSPDGAPRMELNVLAFPHDGLTVEELLASGWEPAVRRACTLAERALKDIEWRAAAARGGERHDEYRRIMGRVPVVLRRLAESLERSQRQMNRRTRHVEERRQDRRPVHKAIPDALAAPDEAFYFDEKTGAMIVCGDQGRAHVFSLEGKHVTSFILRPAAVEFRLRSRRWRKTEPREAREQRERIRTRLPPEGAASASAPRAQAGGERR